MSITVGAGRMAWPEREAAEELAPMLRRLERVDPATTVRMKVRSGRLSAFAVLPSQALVGRTLGLSDRGETDPSATDADGFDATASAAQLSTWLNGGAEPSGTGAVWLRPVPPADGWRRVDDVPEAVVRDVLRLGALAHEDAANLGLGDKAAQNLLDTPVLTVSDGTTDVALTNRSLSALASMGFLVAGSHVVVAVRGPWTRVAAPFGSVFARDRADGLTLL